MSLSTSLLLPFVLLATSFGASAQTYTVLNNCPAPIELIIGNTFDSTLAVGGQVVKTGLGPNPGHFWTTTNNGLRDNTNVAGAAGFRMNVSAPFRPLPRIHDRAAFHLSPSPTNGSTIF